MKGFVAAVLSLVPDWVQAPRHQPLHIALSCDEEAGCRGVPSLLARLPDLCAAPRGCLVGEPTGLQPVLRHKGKAGLQITARGRSGHSARPDLGRNAIHALVPVLQTAVALQAALVQDGRRDPGFAPPHSTVQIGVLEAGQALNIIPDRAAAKLEARSIAGDDPMALLAPVLAEVAASADLEVEVISQYPGLAIDADHPLVREVVTASGQAPRPSVSFGTEAGLFARAGVPAVICGPGDMARAHRPEEYLLRSELQQAVGVLRRLTL